MSITNRTIYTQLGNLFYSVASCEKLNLLHVEQLKLLISKDWVPRSWDDELLLSDEGHFILTEIDALYEIKVSAHDAYTAFARFYSMHPELFSLETKNKMDATSEEIAEHFTEDEVNSNPYLKSSRKLLFTNRMPVY
jgi:hypothetical protein